jgi:hypothetical protein
MASLPIERSLQHRTCDPSDTRACRENLAEMTATIPPRLTSQVGAAARQKVKGDVLQQAGGFRVAVQDGATYRGEVPSRASVALGQRH